MMAHHDRVIIPVTYRIHELGRANKRRAELRRLSQRHGFCDVVPIGPSLHLDGLILSPMEHGMPVRPVTDGADSKATKVKAYWGKTVPVVRETARIPVCLLEQQHLDRIHACQQTMYSRHHTHIHSHSQSQQGKHRLVLQQSWVPGMNGVPVAQENHSAWCGELDGQLMHIHKTLDSMKRRSAQRSAHQQQTEQGQLVAAATDTISLRAKVNASVASQMEFFTAIQSAWCRPGAADAPVKP